MHSTKKETGNLTKFKQKLVHVLIELTVHGYRNSLSHFLQVLRLAPWQLSNWCIVHEEIFGEGSSS